MKIFLLLLIYTLPFIYASSQTVDPVNWDDQFVIVDKNGGAFHSYYEGVEGHPYFIEKFMYASISLSTGKMYNGVKARIDLYKQEIHFRLPSDSERIALPGLITEIIFYDTVESGTYSYTFQAGYPEIDNLKRDNYYQVLSDGELQLLKFTTKEITEEKNVQSGEISKKFITREEYYTFCNGEIKKFKKDKDGLLEMMRDQKEKIQDYFKDKKINFRNISELINLFDYYNSITGKKPF